MAKIAKVTLSKESVLATVFSRERIKAAQNSDTGIINMFIRLVKSETSRGFSTSNIKLGGKEDNYYLLYYYNGIRYKIFKDGSSMISSADTNQRFDEQEKELNAIIETAMANEISRCLLLALSNNESVTAGKPKRINVDDFGCSSSVAIGVMKN